MPHAFELRVCTQFVELATDIRAHQIHPPDNTGYERVRIRQTQQPPRLFNTIAGLNDYGFAHTVLGKYWLKLIRQIVLIQHLH
jgi:hypothetical protein